MKVLLLDLKAQYASIRSEIELALAGVIESQNFILGSEVKSCEEAVARYCTCKFGVGVSSGTDALLVALMALGIGPGDEVITTPYTFFATAGSIARLGAKPVFVDIDPATYNIRADLLAGAVTPRTRAILPVHLFGQMADMDSIMEVAGRHRLPVIEDAAQAIGAEYRGRRAGSLGLCGCFSFFPSKNLGAFGDAGMLVTNDATLAARAATLRAHGSESKYHHRIVGGNFRLDTIQAAVILAKLSHLDRWTADRQSNAARYDRLFREARLCGAGGVTLPHVGTSRHIFNQYVIRVPRRDDLVVFLKKHDVSCEVYYPVPLHLQECFTSLGHRNGDFPESERAARETIALPVYPELADEQAAYVVDCIAAFLTGA